MSVMTIGRSKSLIWGVMTAFAILVLPVRAMPAAENGALSGFVFGADMKTPVAEAIVKIRSLADKKELDSRPTDANGMFTIAGIPEGRYLLGITSGEDDFNFDYSVFIKAGELGKLSVALAPGAGGQQEGAPETKKSGFFNSVAGRVVLVTAVGVAVYFLFFNETSPIR
jgi:predicted secreted protein